MPLLLANRTGGKDLSMQQNKAPFFAIIGLAIMALIGMFLARFFLADSLNLPTGPGEITIRVVVAPSIKPWVDKAAQDFNQANPKTQVNIIAAESLIPESQFANDPQTISPAAWLAEATFVLEMASDSGLQFNDARSVANTSMAWGAFNTRQEEFTQDYGGLTWEALHDRATNPNRMLKVVIASPRNSAEGLAALISATAGHLNIQTLSSADVGSAELWLTETLKESTRSSLKLGPKPAEALATRGTSVGDAGMLTLASWRSARLENRSDFSVTPAQPAVNLDYPFAIWAGSQATPEGQQAAAAFRDFLLENTQQDALVGFFLEQAKTSTSSSVQADGQAALALFRWAERELR
jgi:hypothetical protein